MLQRRHLFAFLILLILVFGLFADLHTQRTKIYNEVNAASLTPGLNKSDICEIIIKSASTTIDIIKQDTNWVMLSPTKGLADPEIVNQILTNVTSARKHNEIKAKNLAEYGLAQPDIELTLKTTQGIEFQMELGHESTYTGQIFAKVNGSQNVVTVGQQVRNCLQRSPNDFRMSRLFDIDNADLSSYKSIKILHKDSHTILEHQANGNWEIIEPNPWAAESSIVEDWIRQCGFLKATGFLTDTTQPTSEEAKRALETPSLFVEISKANGKRTTLSVANVSTTGTPVYVAQNSMSNELLTLTNSTVEQINESESYFRSRAIFSIKPEDVKKFNIDIKLGKTDLVRDDNGIWHLSNDADIVVDQKKVNNAITSLLTSKVKKYVDLNPPDLTAYELSPLPRFKYTITSKNDKNEILACGRSETGNPSMVYAKKEGTPPVFTIDFGREFIITEDQITDKHFMRPDPEELMKIEIEINPEMKYVFERNPSTGIWTLLKPLQQVPVTANNTKLARMITAFSDVTYDQSLRADKDQTIISADLDTTTLKVTYLGIPKGADRKGEKQELLSLRFGKRQPTGVLIESSKNRVFGISPQHMALIDSTIKLAIQ